MSARLMAMSGTERRRRSASYDQVLLLSVAALLGLGLLMVASASITIADRQLGQPFYYLVRQGGYAVAGAVLGLLTVRVPSAAWERAGPVMLAAGIAMLIAVLIPGIGRTVNGSTRWLAMGPINLQVSELVKLILVVYLAGYMVRRGEAVRATVGGFVRPMALVGLLAFLLLLEPDFGAAVVMTATAMGMMFLGGVRLWLFGLLVLFASGSLVLLGISSPYRLERLTTFMNPWADPFDSGFQLTQALIAFGRGEWLGVGLGGSIQKLFYLPEAHTDFLFAVLAEELGLVGAAAVIGLFGVLIWRAFAIGRNAARCGFPFGSHLAYGVGIWLGLQALINMGVNMGVLPTKGLTLPLISYGGSSMIPSCLAIALLLRVDYESRCRDGGEG